MIFFVSGREAKKKRGATSKRGRCTGTWKYFHLIMIIHFLVIGEIYVIANFI